MSTNIVSLIKELQYNEYDQQNYETREPDPTSLFVCLNKITIHTIQQQIWREHQCLLNFKSSSRAIYKQKLANIVQHHANFAVRKLDKHEKCFQIASRWRSHKNKTNSIVQLPHLLHSIGSLNLPFGCEKRCYRSFFLRPCCLFKVGSI